MRFDTKNKLPEDHNVRYVMISDTVFQILMERLIWLRFLGFVLQKFHSLGSLTV